MSSSREVGSQQETNGPLDLGPGRGGGDRIGPTLHWYVFWGEALSNDFIQGMVKAASGPATVVHWCIITRDSYENWPFLN